jgi:antitoxin VapB
METAKVITDGTTQMIILPENMHIDSSEVYVKKWGDSIILLTKDNPWNSLYESLDQFSDDFMEIREQPSLQNREELF